MRMIVALVLILGVGLAGAAVYMAQGQIGQFQAERDALLRQQQQMPRLAPVVIVKKALKYGDRFTAEDLDTTLMAANKLPKGVFSAVMAKQGTPQAATAAFLEGETRPRAALRSYSPNEPLLADKATAPGVDAGISAIIGPNMRAVTLNVNVTSGVSGFLRPGDRVDVFWSGDISGQQVTRLIYPSLRLIAIDQSSDTDRVSPTVNARTVTAEVSPEDVAALTLAQTTGRLTLSLVGMQDTAPVGEIEINRSELLGIASAQQAPAPAAPKVCTIKTRKGAEVIETPIPCAN